MLLSWQCAYNLFNSAGTPVYIWKLINKNKASKNWNKMKRWIYLKLYRLHNCDKIVNRGNKRNNEKINKHRQTTPKAPCSIILGFKRWHSAFYLWRRLPRQQRVKNYPIYDSVHQYRWTRQSSGLLDFRTCSSHLWPQELLLPCQSN